MRKGRFSPHSPRRLRRSRRACLWDLRRPLVEKLICAAMDENTDFEDFDRIAVELLDIMTPDMLAEHHLPESHD